MDSQESQDAKLSRAGVRVDYASAVMLFGMAKGVPTDLLAEKTGVTLQDLIDPDARVPDRAVGLAWRTIGEHCPGEAVGLQWALAAPLTVFGLLAQATRLCPTGYDVLQVVTRYCRVVAGGLDMHLRESDDEIILTLHHEEDETDGGHGAEAAMAIGLRLGREMHGISDVLRVELEYDLHGPLQVYESFFGAEVRPKTGRNAIVFSAEQLACAPPRQPDDTMYAYVQTHLDLAQKQLAARVKDSPLDRVRTVIAEQGRQGRFGAEQVAKAMGMGVRTLQRYVIKHGGSLRGLIDEVREAQARQLLGDERLSVEEVAFIVGYADDRAFRRAYKRWTGTTPAAYRASIG